MDDVALRALDERLSYLRNLEQRKEDVILLIDAQGKLTPELEQQIREATQLQRVEDLYKPYRKKRMTRAQKAREAGLEPLANMVIMQASAKGSALDAAAAYVNEEAGFDTPEKALAGAADIVAETVAEDPENVADLRAFTQNTADIVVEATDPTEKTPYEPYYSYDEPLRRIPNHRVLAIDRGEREGKLRVRVNVDGAAATARLGSRWPRRQGVFAPVFDAAIADGYKRLMAPSLEREARAKLTVRAQTEAISVFAKNLEGLLSARPVRGARVLALDPGYRTGCKVAVMDETGKLLDHGVVYPTKPRHDVAGTKRELARLVKKDSVNTIVIGNGTVQPRRPRKFVSEFIAEQAPELRYTIVNEAGASVYSASELASQEYPDLDVTVRGAMSLGRRLQDPLAELVKIPPQSIGVGQYQHDLDQAELSRTLGHVVEDVVNRVGVDVNTASASLLGYVSGITPSVAKTSWPTARKTAPLPIAASSRRSPSWDPRHTSTPRVPAHQRRQNPLDATSVHPESYEVAAAVLERAGVKSSELSRGGVPDIERRLGSISALASDLDCGTLTLIDIVNELKKPGRDPRDDAPEVVFSRSALSIDDLEPGMELKGTVRNVVDFGAFVDVGVHQDGLVHISKLANRFVKHPSDVVRVGDTVKVWVEKVDRDRKKISLTMVQGK